MSKNIAHVTNTIEQLTSELITENWEEILESRAANEKDEISFSFVVKINFPIVEVDLSFDERKRTEHNSAQFPHLETVNEAEIFLPRGTKKDDASMVRDRERGRVVEWCTNANG